MGFGQKQAQAAEADAVQSHARLAQQQESSEAPDDSGVVQAPARASFQRPAPPQAQAPASAPAASVRASFQRPSPSSAPAAAAAVPPTSSRPSFRRPDDRPAQASSASSTSPAAPPARPGFRPNTAQASSGARFRQAPSELGPSPSVAAPSLPLRLDRLIEEVGSQRGLSPAKIDDAKRQARLNPEASLAKMQAAYQEEVVPKRLLQVNGLKDAKLKNDDAIVFLLIKDGRQRVQVLDPLQANGQGLLDMARVESVPATFTPFPSPSELFGDRAPVVHQNDDSAFTAPPADAPVRSGPRP